MAKHCSQMLLAKSAIRNDHHRGECSRLVACFRDTVGAGLDSTLSDGLANVGQIAWSRSIGASLSRDRKKSRHRVVLTQRSLTLTSRKVDDRDAVKLEQPFLPWMKATDTKELSHSSVPGYTTQVAPDRAPRRAGRSRIPIGPPDA